MRYLFLILFTGIIHPLLSQDFDKTLGLVKDLKNSQYPRSKSLIDKLQKEAQTDYQKNKAGYYLAIYYTQISEYDSALSFLEKVRPFFNNARLREDLGKTYKQTAIIYYSFLNDFVKGKAYLDSAKTFFDSRKSRPDYVECIRHEATIYYLLGDIKRSNQLLIGILPEYEKGSLKYLDIQDLIVNNLIAESNYKSAYSYSKNIPEGYLKLKETRRYAYSLMIRGFLQKKLGMYAEAETNLLRSIDLSNRNEYKENMVDNNRFLGMLYTETSQYPKAEYYLNQALKFTKKVGDTYSMMHIYSSLSRYNIARHNFEMGDYYANEATAMSDSIFKEENNQKLAEYEARYKTAEKEIMLSEAKVEIARKRNWIIGLSAGLVSILLAGILFWRLERVKARAKETEHLKNLEIENQNKLITAREIERRRIAKELHDSVGSQLTVVSTSLDNAFYLFENQKLNPQKLESINSEVRLAAQSLRDTIWATYYSEVSVADLTSRIQEFVKKFTDENSFRVELSFHGDDILLTAIEGLNLFRIIQEALNNTMKYANASLITISGQFNERNFSIEITDNGKGFDLGATHSITTFGLNNMKLRAEELGATLQIQTEEGQGTRIQIHREIRQNAG